MMPCKGTTHLLTNILHAPDYTECRPWTAKQNNEDKKWVTGNSSATYCFLNTGGPGRAEQSGKGTERISCKGVPSYWHFPSKVNTPNTSLQNPFPSGTQDGKWHTEGDKSFRKYSELQINYFFNEENQKNLIKQQPVVNMHNVLSFTVFSPFPSAKN